MCKTKTKQMENEKWIGDVDRRMPPKQGEGPSSVEVMTVIPMEHMQSDLESLNGSDKMYYNGI